ncbi:MAG: serine/threonine protein kinase, partial [Planctomycetes bacterium]|nr:serine/threonine protein kinase [Planctomycetota bacterium]
MPEAADESSAESLPPNQVAPGRRVGAYIVGDPIGKGGMGRLYRAWDTRLNRSVALKVLAGAEALSAENVERFRREVRVLTKLSHPSIVPLLDAGEFDGQPYFVMEFVEGGDLEEYSKQYPVSPSEAADWILQIAEGLSHMHREGLVHRDVKPANILLETDGKVTLVDFGLVHALRDQTANLTQSGVSLGTPAFMAPEQAQGKRDLIDWRTDIYQLGATLFALLAGRPPQRAETPQAMIVKVAEAIGPDWRGVAIARPLRAIIQKAMSRNPAHRYATIDAMKADIQRWRSGEWVQAQRNPVGRAWNFFYRRLALPMLILALGAAMTVTVVLVRDRKGEPAYSPRTISYSDAADGLQLSRVGGKLSPNDEHVVIRDRSRKSEWIGVSCGGRLTWGDTQDLSIDSAAKPAPKGQTPILLGRGDFYASFALRVMSPETQPSLCFLGAPWHDPHEGLAVEVDWQKRRVRAFRDHIVHFDAAWETMREGTRVALSVRRKGRDVLIEGRSGGTGLPSFRARFRDQPTSLHHLGRVMVGGDMQIGAVTKGDQIGVESIAFEQLEEGASLAANLYALGSYHEALEQIDARLGPLGGASLSIADRASYRFMRAECLRSMPSRRVEALDDYQFAIQEGDGDLAFDALMANFELLLDIEADEVMATGEPFAYPNSIEAKVRLNAVGDPVRASIYALRLMRRMEAAANGPQAIRESWKPLFESALLAAYVDDELRLRVLEEAFGILKTQVELNPSYAADYLAVIEESERLDPLRRWSEERGRLFDHFAWILNNESLSLEDGRRASTLLSRILDRTSLESLDLRFQAELGLPILCH